MLDTKLQFINQDKSGRYITIRDATGLESNGVKTGYGPNNKDVSEIKAYYFSVSRIFDGVDDLYKFDGTEEYLPTIAEFATQERDLMLTTNLFSEDSKKNFPEIFKDGIVDVNMYVEFAGLSGVIIKKGERYVYGGDFTDALNTDVIIVNEVIYDIDHSMNNNGGTVLYIIGEFLDDATSFNTAYRSDLKMLLTAMSRHYHDYACKVLSDSLNSPEWNKVNIASSFRLAAKGLFESDTPDYYAANDLIESNFKLLKKYTL